MIFREALISDIPQIQKVRGSVKENKLSNPDLVSDEDCREFISIRGKGWVCEIEKIIVGFAVADLKEHNIWALFVEPAFEDCGIGSELHELMLDWYFGQTLETVWLGTAPNTRAEKFYLAKGWTPVGKVNKGEIKFELSMEAWLSKKAISNKINY